VCDSTIWDTLLDYLSKADHRSKFIIKGYIMATKGVNQRNRKNNPMLTKTGKPRLGPLNVDQLEKMLESARKKYKPVIMKAICQRMKTQQRSTKEEVVTVGALLV
jgi:hypothetical protein